MKNLAKVLVLVLAGISLLGSPKPAAAIPIVYTVSGNASGTIGGTPFSNVLINVSLFSDTSTVQPLPGFPPLVVNVGTTFIGITGIGLSLITDPTLVFSSVIPVEIDDDSPVLTYAVIGTIDDPPAVDNFTGIGVVGSNLLTGYALTSAIGPITASPGGIGYPLGLIIHTTRGDLTFSENPAATGVGTFTAALLPVPEPSSLLSLCAGGLALIFFRYTHWSRATTD
jgi:hypothetical protein